MHKNFWYIVVVLVSAIVLTHAVPVMADTSASVRERINLLQERLDDAVEAGELSRDEAADLQAELDDIRKDYRKAVRYLPLTFAERSRLNARLDELEDDIEGALQKKEEFTPEALAEKKKDLREKIGYIRSRISSSEEGGFVTESEAVELRAELSDIEADLDNMVAKDILTPKKIAALRERLDGLAKEMEKLAKEKKERPFGVMALRDRIEQLRVRISYSLRGGLITLPEARKLRAEVRRVEADLDMLTSEKKLTPGETSALNQRLDAIAAELETLRGMPPRIVPPPPPPRPYR